ncbi:3-dehydroquinate synthase [Bacillaceae bacterium]
MEKLIVDLGERSYPILIGSGLLARIPTLLKEAGIDERRRLYIVCDEHVAPLYLDKVRSPLEAAGYSVGYHIVPAGEKAKDLSVYSEVITQALTYGLDRDSVFLALGGGVIGDLTGFVAATYMRGVAFVQIPTTLLAHDSSVGGKVAVNHPLAKNIIGAFHQPKMVVYDTDTLRTLPVREIAAGFAEIIKHGLIWDRSFFEWLDEHHARLQQLDPPLLSQAIRRACAIKAAVVSQDEKEKGLRAILNLGHTFGHAIEALTGYESCNHGEAVAIGIVLAARLAEKMGLAADILLPTKQILEKYRLPTRCPAHLDERKMIEAMKRDKKGRGGALVFVLPREIGKVEIVRGVDERLVEEVLQEGKKGE